MTVASFMDLALYDPQFGYYARAPRRSGRAGDFFTSVDVGPLFGELLAVQLAEMAETLSSVVGDGTQTDSSAAAGRLDLVEAGAGDGRLSADLLHATRQRYPQLYERVQLHLVEAGAPARAAHPSTLGDTADRLASSSEALPDSFEGVLIANELLDAFPVHQVVMREEGLREVFVRATESRLVTDERAPSTPALADYLTRLNVALEPGWRAEINLRAIDWIAHAARRLRRGFMILIDYGHEAADLYSAAHATGTLTAFARHRSAGPETTEAETPWLRRPGAQDLTAHVDFTSVRNAAEAEGLRTLGFLDQTYFLLGLLDNARPLTFKQRLALKTLVLPGGLGSTMKVLILGTGVGQPALRGCSYRMRVT